MLCVPVAVALSQLKAKVTHLKPPLECMRAFRIYRGLKQLSSPTHVEREFYQLNFKKEDTSNFMRIIPGLRVKGHQQSAAE